MLVIGLTGGIGSGKTQASDWFAKQGVLIIDADILSHEVVKAGSPTLEKIVKKFGSWVLDPFGEMNRRAMREYVFGRPKALLDLEQIIHPAIRQAAQTALEEASFQKNSQQTSFTHAIFPYAILVAPLLLEGGEAGLASLCDRILVVDSTETLQIQRASTRDGQTRAKIQTIMENQLSRHERMLQADDVVSNNGTLPALYAQLETLHQNYLALAEKA